MRDPARINRIIERLRRYWLANPDLRLTQIVVNAVGPSDPAPHIFYVEDDVVEAGIPDEQETRATWSQVEFERGETDGRRGHPPSSLSPVYLRGYSSGQSHRDTHGPWENDR